jgi:hypothetical protein
MVMAQSSAKATIDDENVIRRFVPFADVRFATKADKWIDVSVRQLCAMALNRCAIAGCGVRLIHEHNNQGGDRR